MTSASHGVSLTRPAHLRPAEVVSIARRERGGDPLWLAGLGLAAAAAVLGWFLMLAIVIGATAALILIVHAVL